MDIQSEKTRVIELIDKNSSIIKKVVILSFGATIHQIIVENGKRERNVILGYDTAEEYVPPLRPKSHPYHGSTVGRYANRIANGKFKLND